MHGPRATAPTTAPSEAAVHAFVNQQQRGTWRYLQLCGCSAAVAEEIVQDALVLGVQKGLVSSDPAAARAFLRRTARHLWLRRMRDERRRAARHAEAAERLWCAQLESDDGDGWLAALDACLAALPERSRRVLERTYRDGAGRAAVAVELGIGEHGVRTLLQRLRGTLRDCIERRRTRDE